MSRRIATVAGVLALLAAFVLQLALQARRNTVTWDEAHHLYDGYNIWKQQDYGLNPEVPPLVKMTAAAPLLGMGLATPPDRHRSFKSESFFDGRDFLFSNDANRVLYRARLAAAVFSVILALIVFFAAREMFSTTAAFLALALFVFDPNFLAHGALVTTDLGSALTLFATVWCWYRWRTRPRWPRLLLLGVVAGLALVTKFTGVLIAPMLVLLALAELAFPAHLSPPANDESVHRGHIFLQLLGGLAVTGLVSYAVLWAFYGFRYAARPEGIALVPAFATWVAQLANPHAAQLILFLARHQIFPEAWLLGLADTKITADSYTSFLFGRVYPHGNFLYFPACFVIKSTIPFLALFVLAIALIAMRRFRPWREIVCLTLPPALYFAVAANSNMNIGARHLLPIYPFLYVLTAGAAATLFRKPARLRIPIYRGLADVVIVLVVWQAIDAVYMYPAYMAFANDLWGGPSRVHLYLSDANVDWAQQLNDVRAYLASRGLRNEDWRAPGVVPGQPAPPPSQTTLPGAEAAAKNCWFVYFPDGVVDPPQYGIPCHRLPTQETLFWLREPTDLPPVIDGLVLASASDLASFEFGDGPLNPYDQFNHLKPVAVIDYGVYVFEGRFAIPLAAGLNHAAKAEILLSQHQLKAALAEARQAVALAPQATHAQLALGDALNASGQRQKARAAYQQGLTLATTIRPDLQTEDAAAFRKALAR